MSFPQFGSVAFYKIILTYYCSSIVILFIMKVLVIHGPNLNLLGSREPEIYGSQTLSQINSKLFKLAYQENIKVEIIQSNSENVIIENIHDSRLKFDYIIINAGAYTHYSIAILDALRTVNIPFIEIHISNTYAREEYRHKSLLSKHSSGIIIGHGSYGYELALLSAKHQYQLKSMPKL